MFDEISRGKESWWLAWVFVGWVCCVSRSRIGWVWEMLEIPIEGGATEGV